MIVAKFMKKLDGLPQQDKRLYELLGENRFVIVSAISSAFDTHRAETYIFEADKDGNVIDWMELRGSFQGARDHRRAIENAGWTLEGSSCSSKNYN